MVLISRIKTGERSGRMKTARTIKSTVPENFNNSRIDRYLAERFSYQSRTCWQREILDGRISCNGLQITNHHKKVKTGDSVEYSAKDKEEPPVSDDYAVIYEDNWFYACSKPGNLPVHPSGRFYKNTLLAMLQESTGENFYPLHRLDRETSGIVLFAKNSEAASLCLQTFSSAEKKYFTIAHGIPSEKNFTVNMPIGVDKNSVVRKKRSAYIEADEKAVTHFTLIKSFKSYTLLEAILETGRLHQIRVHLQHAGLPIFGDKLYGLDEKFYLRFIDEGNSESLIKDIGFHRTALHAHSLEFYHPYLKKRIILKSPVPNDMKSFIKGLYKMEDYYETEQIQT